MTEKLEITPVSSDQGKCSQLLNSQPILLKVATEGPSLIEDAAGNPSIEPDVTASTTDDLNDAELLCCQNFEVPYQPTATDLEKSKHQSGQQSISIQTCWYVKYRMHFIIQNLLPCLCNTKYQNLIHSLSHYNPTFVEGGFSNWKKAIC